MCWQSQEALRDRVSWVGWYLPETHGPFLSFTRFLSGSLRRGECEGLLFFPREAGKPSQAMCWTDRVLTLRPGESQQS